METTTDLKQKILSEVEKVNEIIEEWRHYPNTIFSMGIPLIEEDVSHAQKAIQDDDVLEMISAYRQLKEWTHKQ